MLRVAAVTGVRAVLPAGRTAPRAAAAVPETLHLPVVWGDASLRAMATKPLSVKVKDSKGFLTVRPAHLHLHLHVCVLVHLCVHSMLVCADSLMFELWFSVGFFLCVLLLRR